MLPVVPRLSRSRLPSERNLALNDRVMLGFDLSPTETMPMPILVPRAGGRGTVASVRNLELEDEPGRDVAGEDLVEAGVDVVEFAARCDHLCAAGGVQFEHLGKVEAGTDDRADHRDALEHCLEDGQRKLVVTWQCDENQAAAALERVESLTHGLR